jgi:hypothetical protein
MEELMPHANMKRRRRRSAARISVAAVGAAATLVLPASLNAEDALDYLPAATLVEIMDSMVMPLAQVLWDAVVYEDTIKGPETDEGWQNVRAAAVSLAESANVLMIPGRAVASSAKTAAEGELSPQEIQTLIDENHGAWVGHARGLHEIAMQAIEAIEAKDAEKLADVGGTLDSVCESCHLQFWYPDQQ